MNNIKSAAIRTKKSIISFLREIFASVKGLGILCYIILCALLWQKFADLALVDAILHDFQFSWGIMPRLIYHACALFMVLLFGCMITYALGACIPEKLAIKHNISAAQLPRHEAVGHPSLILYIPHRKARYIEMEFISKGISVERWEERRTEVESALNMTIIGKFEVGDRYDIVKFRAVNGIRVPNKNALYDED